MDLSKHLQKAEDATRRRNYPLAIGLYQQILDLDPNSAEARVGLRRALDKKFEGKKGGGLLARVQGFLPLLSAGIAKLTRCHGSRARSLERFLALAPHDVRANLALGLSLYRAGHKDSAYVVYRHLGERLSEQGRTGPHADKACQAWRAAGAVAHELGKLQQAMECYEAALQINPRDQDALRARKNLSAEGQLSDGGFASARSSRDLIKDKEEQGKLERAQRLHKSADELEDELGAAEAKLAQTPGDPRALREVGELRAQKGDVGGALDCLEAALRAEPDDARLMTRVGELKVRELQQELAKARKLEDHDKVEDLEAKVAKLELDEAARRVAAHPTDLGMRHELGLQLLAAGDLDGAIAEFQKSVKDPRHKLDALLELGRAFRQKGMLDLARNQLEKALGAAGAQSARALDLLYELGGLCETQNQPDEARGYYSRILEVDIGYRDVTQKLEALSAKDTSD